MRIVGSGARRRDAASGGFSLIELMIALTLFSIMLLGIIGLLRVGLQRTSFTGMRIKATEIMRQEVDRLESLTFADDDLKKGKHDATVDKFTVEWKVTDDKPVKGAKRLDATVSWKNPLSITEKFELSTYLVDRP